MISLIGVLNYRCLRHIRLPLGRLHVLAGPNGSGKTTLLEAVRMLASFVREGLGAFLLRADNFRDMLWRKQGERFEMAIEVALPSGVRRRLREKNWTTLRYEISVGFQNRKKGPAILAETVWLKPESVSRPRAADLFPSPVCPAETILESSHKRRGEQARWRKVVTKVSESGNDYYLSETSDWHSLFKLGAEKSALGNLPADETKWPASAWFREFLENGLFSVTLDLEELKAPSYRPGTRESLRDWSGGSWLPWAVRDLEKKHPRRLSDWIDHIRTILPEVRAIKSIERPEDRKRHLVVEYENGLALPSWAVSDGTLRMLALTLLAYLRGTQGTILIDEPENGLHPLALQAVFASLSSASEAQVLLATHSPILLALASPENVLCFAKTADGATDIVRGSEHPKLRDWQGQPSLDVYFASGILG